MKFNFKKIASVLASAVMLGSTLGIAMAANYPTPFSGGDVAVVYGASAGTADLLAATDVNLDLQGYATATTTSTTGSVSGGEAAALFTSSSKVYANTTLNNVKSVVTKTEMPVLLKEETFSGNVDAKTTQTIVLGSSPIVTFAKQPTSSVDPLFALTTSSSTGVNTYNATVDFSKAVNFTHADSKNQELTVFGQKFTVGAATDTTSLILLKSATTLNFDSSGTTSQEATVGGNTYTIEMVSASTNAATIKVTNAAGTSEQKEVNEGYSKKVNGVTIAVNTADSNNLKYTTSLVAGAEKYTLTSGSAVTYGDSDTVMDGTLVTFTGGVGAMTKMVISVRAPDSDHDSINPGASFTDPVFGSFKVDFPGLNIADDSTTARETIKVYSSGDDKMMLSMTDNNGNAKSFQWAYNVSGGISLYHDTDAHDIHVAEMQAVNRSDYIVLGNEDEGRLMKVYQITNQTTGYSSDKVTFQDVFSGDSIDATLTGEGVGTVTIGGKVYSVGYFGANTLSSDAMTVRLNYPDSSSNDMIIYPTLQTSKGAKVAFYKPLTINLADWDGAGADVSNIKLPNGADAYQSVAILYPGANFSVDGTMLGATGESKTVAITNTGFTFNFTRSGVNETTVYLLKNEGGNAADPALMVYEEKDNNNRYYGMIVTLEPGSTSDDGIGVADVMRTWSNDLTWDAISLASDSKKSKEADYWGTIASIDSSDSDQATATIYYPDEQVYAQLYVSGVAASVTTATTTGTTGTAIGNVIVKDSEIASVSSKNLLVLGGSCVNEAARKIVDATATAAICGADWTNKTGVAADQALVKVVKNPYLDANTTKIAMLVAGYEAADTTKAAKYLTTSKPSSAVGTSVKLSTSATVATVVTA